MNHFLDYIQKSWVELAIISTYIVTIQFLLGEKFYHMSIWKTVAISTSLPLVICCGLLGYLYFTTSLSSDRRDFPKAKIEWRTQIKESDTPATWPFIETSYMLGCLGADGDYSVYLVKLEDIKFSPDRGSNFRPQYYGLKGSWNGWKNGETQLLEGQQGHAYNKYVDQGLLLCKEAESRKDALVKQPSVEKN